MQVFQFWLFDVSGGAGNILFSIFDPTLAFSACTAPEIIVEPRVVQPGNWEFKRKVVKTADVSPVSLSRGTQFFDSDFYNWISNAIRGRQPVRRDIVLIHFLPFSVQRQFLFNGTGPELGITSLGERTPGRAWLLHGCLPTRYKAGSDFDATASDVSIQELELAPEHVDEITLATISPLRARAASAAIQIADAVV
jgi:phage tail-like protein